MFSLTDRLVPTDLPRATRVAAWFYLIHIILITEIAGAEIAVLFALIAGAVAWRRSEITLRFHELYVPMLLFAIASLGSALAAPEPMKSLRDAFDFAPMLAFPVALTLLRTEPRLVRSTLGALITLVMIQSAIGFAQFAQLGGVVLEKRITGSASHVMSFAGILLPVSVFAVVYAVERRQLLIGIAGAISAAALGLSLTRSAWIGWIAGLGIYLLIRRPRATVAVVAVTVLVVTLSPLSIFGRLASSLDTTKSSNLDRIRMAQAGVEMIKDHPLLGLGPANLRAQYPLYRLPDAPRYTVPHLHNNAIQLWAERGVIAVFSYLLLLILILKQCSVCSRGDGDTPAWGFAGAASLIALTVAGLFEYNFGDSEVLMTLLVIAALVSYKAETVPQDPPTDSPKPA